MISISCTWVESFVQGYVVLHLGRILCK
jgi:hypothetical protein